MKRSGMLTFILNAIDKCLKDITDIHSIFSGKIILLGGDYRHILPILLQTTQKAILDICFKYSHLWLRQLT